MKFRALPLLSLCAVLFGLTVPQFTAAETVYVSDQLEITLRTGPGIKNKITAMLNSGDELEVLQRNPDGYTEVRAPNGKTGWVLQRFLMNEPAARSRLEEVKTREQQVAAQQAEIEQLRENLSASRTESADVQVQNSELKAELERVRKVAADTLAINENNAELAASLEQAEARQATLQIENERLRSNAEQAWFVRGAGVILLGMLLGLLIPKLRFKKKRKWGDFSVY